MDPTITWRGDVVDHGDAAVYRGAFGPTRIHRHYAVQLVHCPQGLTISVDDEPIDVVSAVIGSGVAHGIASSGIGEFSYFAPHSQRGRRWQEYLDGRQVAAVDGPPAPSRPSGERHDLAVAIVTWVGERVAAEPDRPLRADDATAQFHLSQSAILRTLRDELAVTFSSVVKWERLCVALRLIVDGASVTEAAIGGGFFDGPHFTRACNEMLGLPPKLLDVGLVRPA
ncbi:MAG TPA: helix-turn-helix domain-containing protein [Gordonia sp. (in: high G+C Gram-positive bacteria)]|uniref:helix-turn-helix transcriptional regulator n=1 Tax=unclassified Gordonia (in: high G+C Gram-positive bacteria) TaxID=2657482 RepID=UPI0025B9EA15|nr:MULTISPECIES: helix-turn-helix domain-containing protein [unclassified Gordonia (in: high G+C Gram-positive bacteria)]HNP56252.1 helix-turn-helix domain-containing protein [Gordonia sp. (in: high G+C Gram-positive bacteria)]HRC52457.1 helix-turn-helix domain-containing protein [Gordonia sp. (in: high G+C Gram-positive bacteria)]